MLYANGQPVGGGGAGGNTNSVELTYAEYLALSDAEKMNGTEYFITDINGDGSQFQPVIYSTEEREIGVFADGKPLYKKTWIFSSELTISQSSFTDTSIDSTDIENIVKVEAIHDDGTCFEGVMADPTKSNHTIVGLQTTRNNNGCSIKKLTLQYTKISDAAGSGTWTPQGVPAVHYSTDEHVIGTWIDGKTLYEKSYSDTAPSSVSSKNYSLGVSNVDKIIDYDAIAYRNDGAMCKLDHSRGDDTIWTMINSSNEFVVNIKDSQYVSQPIYFTVRYTKSS